jgi:hypothetical protein
VIKKKKSISYDSTHKMARPKGGREGGRAEIQWGIHGKEKRAEAADDTDGAQFGVISSPASELERWKELTTFASGASR